MLPESSALSVHLQAYKSMGRIDLYGLNAPICQFNEATDKSLPPPIPTAGNPHFDPCGDYRIWWYMNRLEVQQAFNVLPKESSTEVQWNSCGESVNISYAPSSIGATVSQLYPELMASGIEVLLISGNDDGYVPTLGTRTWIGVLKKVVVVPVRSTPASADATVDQVPWVNNQTGQVGGYITKYRLASKRGGSFELAVVMNAGHQPPYFQPAGVAQLVSGWINQISL